LIAPEYKVYLDAEGTRAHRVAQVGSCHQLIEEFMLLPISAGPPISPPRVAVTLRVHAPPSQEKMEEFAGCDDSGYKLSAKGGMTSQKLAGFWTG